MKVPNLPAYVEVLPPEYQGFLAEVPGTSAGPISAPARILKIATPSRVARGGASRPMRAAG